MMMPTMMLTASHRPSFAWIESEGLLLVSMPRFSGGAEESSGFLADSFRSDDDADDDADGVPQAKLRLDRIGGFAIGVHAAVLRRCGGIFRFPRRLFHGIVGACGQASANRDLYPHVGILACSAANAIMYDRCKSSQAVNGGRACAN